MVKIIFFNFSKGLNETVIFSRYLDDYFVSYIFNSRGDDIGIYLSYLRKNIFERLLRIRKVLVYPMPSSLYGSAEAPQQGSTCCESTRCNSFRSRSAASLRRCTRVLRSGVYRVCVLHSCWNCCRTSAWLLSLRAVGIEGQKGWYQRFFKLDAPPD